MQAEYLLFNIIIALGPVSLSFDRRVHFIRLWIPTLLSAFASAVPFIIWDVAVQGRHWYFSEMYTFPFRLFGLPVEEWLFFITVPFACIFIWEVLAAYFRNYRWNLSPYIYALGIIALAGGFSAFLAGLEYTGLAFGVFGLILFLDRWSGIRVLDTSRAYVLAGIVTILMLLFNGYLTARPIVTYNPLYQLNWRIFTIPLEDFFFGYAHILLSILIYDYIKRRIYE